MPVRLTILIALLAALLAAPVALAQGGLIQEVATALQRDSVYVDFGGGGGDFGGGDF